MCYDNCTYWNVNSESCHRPRHTMCPLEELELQEDLRYLRDKHREDEAREVYNRAHDARVYPYPDSRV